MSDNRTPVAELAGEIVAEISLSSAALIWVTRDELAWDT